MAKRGARKPRASHKRQPARPGAGPAFLFPALLALAGIVVFIGILPAEWVFDDMALASEDEFNRWSVFGLLARGFHEHPIRGITFLFDYALFGSSPAAFHAHNIVWHVISTLLLYATVRKLSERAALAFFAALIFAVLPAHVEAVAVAWHRKELLCLAFSLVSFLCYTRFVEATDRSRWRWLGVCAVTLYLALASKQVAVALPLSFAAYEWFLVAPERRFLTRKPLLLVAVGAAVGVAGAAYLIAAGHFSALDQVITFDGYSGEPTAYAVALTSARMFWRYLYLLAVPVGLCPDYLVPLSRSLLEPATALAWGGLLAVIAGTASARRWPVFAFGVSWFVIHFLPISNLAPSTYLLADRYMYVPSAGFCIAAACAGLGAYDALRGRVGHTRAAWVTGAVAALVILSYAGSTWGYVARWRSNLTLMSYTLERCNPKSHRAHSYLGIERAKLADYTGAERYFDRAIELSNRPNRFALFNRGNVRLARKDFRGAAQDYARAVDSGLDSAEVHYKLGTSHFQLERFSHAVAAYGAALERDPGLAPAYRERALAQARMGRTAQADADYERARALRPAWAEPMLLDLAETQQRSGNVAGEVAYLTRAAAAGSSRAAQRLKQRALQTGDPRFLGAPVQ